MSLKGRSLYRAMIKKGLLHADVTRAVEGRAIRSNTDQSAKGVRGNLEGLKVKDRGPGRYSTLGGLLGKGHWTLAQTYMWRRSLMGEGLSRQWTQEAGPMGNQRWDKVDGRDTLSDRIHAERETPVGAQKVNPYPSLQQGYDFTLCLPVETKRGANVSLSLPI